MFPPINSKEVNDEPSSVIVGKCYSVREIFDRTMQGMPCSVSTRQLEHRDDVSDFFDEDDDLVRISEMRDFSEQLEEAYKFRGRSSAEVKEDVDPAPPAVEKPVEKPVDKPVDK